VHHAGHARGRRRAHHVGRALDVRVQHRAGVAHARLVDAGDMEDADASAHAAQQRLLVEEVAAHGDRPGVAHGSFGVDAARERTDLAALGDQMAKHRAADEAAGAGDEHRCRHVTDPGA
jgi:hypothetical protein